MGMFDFLKNVGLDLFGGGSEAQKITELIQKELGTKITNLEVTFNDGVVTLSGSCDSQETKEKAILLAGNIKGVARVDDSQLTAPPAQEQYDFYTIKRGDSLSKIARQYYGDPMKYPVLFEANREIIKNPDLIYPGQVIRVPRIKK